MAKLLDAASIIEGKIPELIKQSQQLTQKGLTPNLTVILVGNNSASQLYIRNKERFCKRIEADFKLIHLPEDTSKEQFLDTVNQMNNDPKVTGCFVQLPVPKHLSNIDITQIINPEKDVDGFHLNTVTEIYRNNLDGLLPCTPKGILTLLSENQIELSGKHVVVIGRSFIVGKPLILMLNSLNATVTACHSRTQDLSKFTKTADIIISAVGVPHLIGPEHLSGNQIIIDVGMNKLDGKTVGDVNFSEVESKAGAITPVPGGVGPMTVFSLMQNLLKTTERILKKEK